MAGGLSHINLKPNLRYDNQVTQQTCIGPREMPNPWDDPVPAVLYKYFPPERLHVLTDAQFRFSQRGVFDDERELKPEVAAFGTEDEIRNFIELGPEKNLPLALKDATVKAILTEPGEQGRLARLTQERMQSPDQFGIFCMTEVRNNDSMWKEYADNGRGFVVAFDTTCPAFDTLRNPGRIGKVTYSDEPIGTFLGSYGVNSFFLKRNRYKFEDEWRCVRALYRLERGNDNGDFPILLATFDPACITEILIRPTCLIEWKLRLLVETDIRYRHVSVRLLTR